MLKDILDKKDIPTLYKALEEFKVVLNELQNVFDQKLRFEKIESFWKEQFEFFPFLLVEHDLKKGNSFYRVRVDKGDLNRNLIQEFSTLPVNLANSYQRVNIPKNPVFYAGFTMDVAIYETLHYPESIGSSFYLSKWKTKEDLQVNVTQFLFKETLNSNFGDFAKSLQSKMEHLFNDLSSEQKIFVDKFMGFIINEFLNDSNYVLSSYVGHEQIFAPHNFHSNIIYYPSIKKQRNGINVAIHPNFVNKYLELEKIYFCKVADLTNTNIETTFFQVGQVKESRIIWQNMSEEDIKEVKVQMK